MMQSSSLACPYCGSTLNFGAEIAAGAAVECIVCMQSFTIQQGFTPTPMNHAVSSNPPARPEAAKAPAPKMGSIVRAKAKIAPPKQQAAETAKSFHAPIPAPSDIAATERQNPGSSAHNSKGKVALITVGLGLLLLLTAGAGLSIWKLSGEQARKEGPKEVLLAANENVVPEGPPKDAPPTPAVDAVPPPIAPKKPAPAEIFAEPPPLKLDTESDPQPKGVALPPEPPKAKEPDVLIPVKGVAENPVAPPPAIGGLDPKRPLPWGVDQPKINAAIDKGVVYLKANQNFDGSWGAGHPIGHAALGGLTLLESGVAPTDLVIQRAAALVRNSAATLDQTYELSLAILFLDRLGNAKDRFTIQNLALRLIAGQTASGGWSYHCPLLNSNEKKELFTFLHVTKKPNVFDNQPMMARAPQSGELTTATGKESMNLGDPVTEFTEQLSMATGNSTGPMSPANPRGPAKGPGAKGANPPAGKANAAAVQPNWLKQVLPTLPIVQQQGAKKGKFKLTGDRSDNSNTQFALLALWVAGRHDVPAAPAFLGAHQRFIATQHGDGGWSYMPAGPKGSTPSMTCVGLLGIAMGHGAQPEIVGVNPKNAKEVVIKPALKDPRVQVAVKALGRVIGTPSPKARAIPMHNLYELWSIERAAMLYELKTIDGKDWYGWGAQILLHNQGADGAWAMSSYPGQNPYANTCLALLFLKRSNLAQDLTRNLRMESALSEPLRVDQERTPGP